MTIQEISYIPVSDHWLSDVESGEIRFGEWAFYGEDEIWIGCEPQNIEALSTVTMNTILGTENSESGMFDVFTDRETFQNLPLYDAEKRRLKKPNFGPRGGYRGFNFREVEKPLRFNWGGESSPKFLKLVSPEDEGFEKTDFQISAIMHSDGTWSLILHRRIPVFCEAKFFQE